MYLLGNEHLECEFEAEGRGHGGNMGIQAREPCQTIVRLAQGDVHTG